MERGLEPWSPNTPWGLNQVSLDANFIQPRLVMILNRCLDGKYSTLLLQGRYNELEICYKCATIAGAIEWPTWKMGASCGTLPTEVLRVSEDGQMAIQRGWPRTPQQGGRRCSWPPRCGVRGQPPWIAIWRLGAGQIV